MGKESPISELDELDRAMLRHLQEDGRLSNAKLAERLSLSETPCWRRLKRLEAEGYIEGYQANLNRRKLGYGVLAFVQLSVSIHTDEATARFENVVRSCPEVIACHNITGQADFLLQVVAPDLDSYGQFIDRVFRKLPEIRAIHSSVSLREIKASNRLPLA
jgi:Lrp/AsnC family transcriptional regulator, leucine-responsive regulatory protein